MNLDRGLIKQQARALIKDKVMKLFITSFVVSIAIMAIGGLSFSITSTSSNDIFNGSDYSFSDNGNSNDKIILTILTAAAIPQAILKISARRQIPHPKKRLFPRRKEPHQAH